MRSIGRHLPASAATMVGVMLAFWSVLQLRDAAGLSLNVVVLAVSLAATAGRVVPETVLAARLLGLLAVPLAAVAATEVGVLFRTHANVGDAVFVLVLAGAVWLRRFGRAWAGVGTLLSLPFIAILVAPLPQLSGLRYLLWSGLAAVVTVAWVAVVHVAAGRPAAPPAPPVRAGSGRLSTSTRMAVQLAAALTAAFVIGRVWYPDHWVWPVLTAYIVCSGNRGRADVVYKGLLRVAGALAGTLVATALLVGVFGAGSNGAVAGIFILLAVGTALRPLSYAYWAGCVTAALAFLYGYFGQSGGHLLYTRLAGILCGGAAAIVASWLLLPVRSADVLRARRADVLAALTDFLVALAREPVRLPWYRERFENALAHLDRIAPALIAGEWVTRRWSTRTHHTATIAALHRCATPVRELAGTDPQRLRTRAVATTAATLASRLGDLRRSLASRTVSPPATTPAAPTPAAPTPAAPTLAAPASAEAAAVGPTSSRLTTAVAHETDEAALNALNALAAAIADLPGHPTHQPA